jgi:hypothetical protein
MTASPNIIRKTATSKKDPSKREGRTRRFTIVDENRVDRDGDIMLASGGDWSAFDTNSVVLFNHEFGKPAVGKCVAHGLENDETEVWADIEFATTDLACDLLKLYDGSFMRAASLGFRPIEVSPPDWKYSKNRTGQDQECIRVIKRWHVLELSLVTIGSQPNALMKALESPGFITTKSIRESLKEAIVSTNRRKSADNTATAKPTSTASGMQVCPKCKKPCSSDVCKCNGGAQGNENGIAAADAVKRMKAAISGSLTEEQRLALAVQNKVKTAIEDGTLARNILEQVATQCEVFSAAKQLGNVLDQVREFAEKSRAAEDELSPGGRFSGTSWALAKRYGPPNLERPGSMEFLMEEARRKQAKRGQR